MTNILKIIFGMIVSLVFITVFIRYNQVLNNFIAKNFFFYFSSVFIFLSIILAIIYNKNKLKLSINKLDIVVLLYYLYSFVRLIFTTNVPIINDNFTILTLIILFYFVFKFLFQKYSVHLMKMNLNHKSQLLH